VTAADQLPHRPINGNGDRVLAEEQAKRLRHLADELRRDLRHWAEHLTGEQADEVCLRIQRHRAEALAYENRITEYDTKALA